MGLLVESAIACSSLAVPLRLTHEGATSLHRQSLRWALQCLPRHDEAYASVVGFPSSAGEVIPAARCVLLAANR
jgi:hypothetical protein